MAGAQKIILPQAIGRARQKHQREGGGRALPPIPACYNPRRRETRWLHGWVTSTPTAVPHARMKKGFYTIMAAQFFSSLADNALFVAAVELLKTSG